MRCQVCQRRCSRANCAWPRGCGEDHAVTRTTIMSAVFDRPSLWQRLRPMFGGFDGTLTIVAALLAGAGLITMYSAGFDHGTRFVDHARNMALAFVIMFIVAQIP